MSDTASEQSPSAKSGPAGPAPVNAPVMPAASEKRTVAPASGQAAPPEVRRVKTTGVKPKERRDFFSDAMKEVLSPFAGAIERKINPLLDAIEAIPTQAEKFGKMDSPKLDQLHIGKYSLPIGGGGGGGTKRVKREPKVERYLRPPGAMEPGEFERICSRCGKCVEACPADAIQLDPNHLTADGFPYIVPDDQPCVVCDELACMKSCPTGALRLVDVLQIKMGTAKVDHGYCLRDRGENCTQCVDVCPVANEAGLQAITVNAMTGRVIVRKNICIGCGLCENRCPTEPRAITITPAGPRVDPIIA
ncbi:MAG TPA: 4Fe-4S dicluster domain-containing protein [Phycisphaerae bacterium]|nr:4Fe-4S dicluster domain-containing protein [Phycisphaerae bacterium]